MAVFQVHLKENACQSWIANMGSLNVSDICAQWNCHSRSKVNTFANFRRYNLMTTKLLLHQYIEHTT